MAAMHLFYDFWKISWSEQPFFKTLSIGSDRHATGRFLFESRNTFFHIRSSIFIYSNRNTTWIFYSIRGKWISLWRSPSLRYFQNCCGKVIWTVVLGVLNMLKYKFVLFDKINKHLTSKTIENIKHLNDFKPHLCNIWNVFNA